MKNLISSIFPVGCIISLSWLIYQPLKNQSSLLQVETTVRQFEMALSKKKKVILSEKKNLKYAKETKKDEESQHIPLRVNAVTFLVNLRGHKEKSKQRLSEIQNFKNSVLNIK